MAGMDRRKFLTTTALAATPLAAAQPVRFGIDLFSIRSQGWTPFQYLDYCARWKAKVVHFSEIRFIGSLEEANLRAVRAHAEKLGIEIEIGMRSICPTSKMFDPAQGTAEEQLTRMIHAARVVGSPIIRAVLGSMPDRTRPVPVEGHIENTAKVLRNVRPLAVANSLNIAIENHAAAIHTPNLKLLI